jgi:hypothetical protein
LDFSFVNKLDPQFMMSAYVWFKVFYKISFSFFIFSFLFIFFSFLSYYSFIIYWDYRLPLVSWFLCFLSFLNSFMFQQSFPVQ